jgi:hypothetical protein
MRTDTYPRELVSFRRIRASSYHTTNEVDKRAVVLPNLAFQHGRSPYIFPCRLNVSQLRGCYTDLKRAMEVFRAGRFSLRSDRAWFDEEILEVAVLGSATSKTLMPLTTYAVSAPMQVWCALRCAPKGSRTDFAVRTASCVASGGFPSCGVSATEGLNPNELLRCCMRRRASICGIGKDPTVTIGFREAA